MGHEAWLRAYLEKTSGKETACPDCRTGIVSWRVVAAPATRMGYALLWCNQCHKGTHLSRIRVPEGVDFVSILDLPAASDGVPSIEFVDE